MNKKSAFSVGTELYQNMAFSKVYNVSNVLLVNEFLMEAND